MRYFEDLIEGEARISEPSTVDAEAALEFARQYDPQYFHTDEKAAERSIFGGVIISGIYTMALWRKLDHTIAHDIAWICGVAWDDVCFPRPVRAGDRLRARARCVSKRPSRSHPERGIVVYAYALFNQNDEIVFTCLSTNLVERRESPATTPDGKAAPASA
jgi:acyl dehydratase